MTPLWQPSQLRGIGWMVLHCFIISCMSAMIKLAEKEVHLFQIVFFHNLVSFGLVAPYALRKGFKPLQTNKFHLHATRAMLGFTAFSCYFYAFTRIPLTDARAVALGAPLVSSLFAVIFLKERMGIRRTTALIIGIVGSLIILRPGTETFSPIALFVVASLFLWGFIDIIIKVLGRTEATVTQVFYLTGLMTLISCPFALSHWKTPQHFETWLLLFGIGALFLPNVIAVFQAFKHAEITVIMPFDFTGMIFTAIIAYLFFGEIMDSWTLAGSLVIISSTVYMAWREAQLHRRKREPGILEAES
jgi:drug/metabolite transporter (DMT)-like permease